jgi:hypothetical protein
MFTRPLTAGETQLIEDALDEFYFTEPDYRTVFESHATRVVQTLIKLGHEVTARSIVAHIEPKRLLDLSYDLPHEEGEELTTYLADLPEWVPRYLSNASEFLLERLSEQGWSPLRAA